jgi:hypothetical protein
METFVNWVIVFILGICGIAFLGLWVRVMVYLFCLGYGC